MQPNLIDFSKYNILYKVGNANTLNEMQKVSAMQPFSERIIDFLNELSSELLHNKNAKAYPDVVTFAFWIRKASVENMKRRFHDESSIRRLGRGVIFHIAPSNVPVNYAYSLVVGLLCGNANVVRIPSKDFLQVAIINQCINKVLENYKELASYITLIKYGHDKNINDALSGIADVRVVWGGDNTINEIRQSRLKPRSTEVTFADRYSLAFIDADEYLKVANKEKVANDFYNDTYLTDQNACTSPRVAIWYGENISEAKEIFWSELHRIVEKKYELQDVCAVNKLTSSYLLPVFQENVQKVETKDNLIIRMKVSKLSRELMDLKDNSGYFFEYDCKDIMEIKDICDDTHCQTISYIADSKLLLDIVKSGVRGIDRIVPVGKTMDFDFIWDGYNLYEMLTRNIHIIGGAMSE